MSVRYRRNPELRLTALEGEGVVLHLGTRRYFTVTETGLVILEALASPCSESDLVSALVARYQVSPEHALASVREFLDRCRRSQLLIVEEE